VIQNRTPFLILKLDHYWFFSSSPNKPSIVVICDGLWCRWRFLLYLLQVFCIWSSSRIQGSYSMWHH